MAGKVIISCAITDGPCWPPVAARCRLRRGQRQWEGMFASVSRTVSGSTKGNWHRAMPPRSRGVRHTIEGLGLEAATPCESPGYA